MTLPWLLSWQTWPHPVVCPTCWQTFERITPATACISCGRQLTRRQMCSDCQRWPSQPRFYNQALFCYNAAMHDYFQRYKFQGDYRLRAVFAAAMQQRLATLAADCVVAIPVTPATMQYRGFNQVTGWLGTGLNDPVGLQTIAQTKARPQSQKTRAERLTTSQPFSLSSTFTVTNQRVVIVDDIYTTGRTIRHAADLLLESGAKSVIGLTLAR
ncbi:ComF family protein [Lactiplantibacillus fabifermentans]|uniref:ComF family protein n=1 Tax=Lactiplantibacillus fabifermentans TaxID=483011 RepID=UPI001F17FAB0|nr:ComF family protein [Lactiplantibacillus fabifermentans]